MAQIPSPAMVLNTAPLVKPQVDPNEKPGLNKDRHPGIAVLDISEIKANEFQPRRDFDQRALEELAQSIKENGLIQPLVVRKSADGYELIAGERRLRASKIAGLKMVPVVIRKSTDREALELAIVENIQREDLNCVDEALAYFQLMQEFQLSQEELAKRMGKERATIANALRVLKLSDLILAELKKGALSRGHAKALLSVEDVADRERLAKEILEKSLSVRQAEKVAQEKKAQAAPATGNSTRASTPTQDPEIARLTQELTRRLMSKVEFKGGPKTGQIQIQYSSKEELYRIVGTLLGE
ncbi:MAG: ParB/RepB/Spo0J family partition protein [Proteobacteria bacterium]|nr:ParB/RepB/Spo0J family partition protein [Pseudomonadota bacterium]